MNKFVKPLAVLGVLVVLWLVVQLTSRDYSRPDPKATLSIDLEPTAVSRVEIYRSADSVVLVNGMNGWQVKTEYGDKPADPEAITNVFGQLGQIKTSDIVSHNPKKHLDYRVDDSTGTRVRIFGQDDVVLAVLIIGKLGGFSSQAISMQQGNFGGHNFYTYLRRAGSDRVYKVRGFLSGAMTTDASQWRDHKIMRFHPTTACRISLNYPDETVVLEKDTTRVWTMIQPENSAVDSITVARLVGALSGLFASGFVDTTLADSVLGLDNPQLRVEVKLEDGTELKVAIGNPLENNLYYCKIPDEDQVYTLAQYRLDQIMKRADDLIKKEEEKKKEAKK